MKGAIEEASGCSWAREVARRADPSQYEELQTKLDLAAYTKKGTGEKIRRTIKERIEWGDHWG